MNQEVGGMGQTKGKAKKKKAKRQSKTMRAKVHSNGTTMHAHSDHLLANSRSPSYSDY